MDDQLQEALLKAHDADDGSALVVLYAQAADQAEGTQDFEKACFFLTHAWIFALEADHDLAGPLRDRLLRHGRV